MASSSNGKRIKAIKALKVELNKQGFITDYPPDTSSEEYKVGVEIWVPMPALFTDMDRNRDSSKIRAVNERVAKEFNLASVGKGPVVLENALYFVCCGFRRESV